ncbi:hypothetical protein GDO81_002199 [Engystomops pustulosus]|uniref:Uncharacterized protein n=1 Tax=Engystomops pustulosus TaxID=76066 RepID=A0AAV7DI89_ENGPU|nr:hypothetical protein GDO81_002199 [Engystomops pustulosus]
MKLYLLSCYSINTTDLPSTEWMVNERFKDPLYSLMSGAKWQNYNLTQMYVFLNVMSCFHVFLQNINTFLRIYPVISNVFFCPLYMINLT